ncbi:hypothetical protein HN587_02325 [Candidatus Woesearchaeota archaeon]|jgi:hypothetical protein|nr:hypothetical protein [Candidatus Woesearchaeota archaeon]
MHYVKSNLCHVLDLSCIGCCGSKFSSKSTVAKGIQSNTLEFKRVVNDPLDLESLKSFRDRHPKKKLHESGICRNLVYNPNSDRIFCPIHPEQCGVDHRHGDLRTGHCDILHVCKAAFMFELWHDEKKKEFIKFLRKKRSKGLSWYEFSQKMDDDSLLYEFEGI